MLVRYRWNKTNPGN